MPNHSLIIGPPQSGKTALLLGHAAERYAENPFSEVLIIVPTVRHADQVRRRLVDLCGIAFQLRVETMGQFSGSLIDPSSVVSADIADELLSRVATEATAGGGADYFAPIAQTNGFHRLLSSAVSDLMQEHIDPDLIAAAASATGDQALQGLARIYRAYTGSLKQRSWRHPAEVASIAADHINDGASVPPLVLVDGFEALREGELRLIEALATKADTHITMNPHAGDRSAHAHAALKHRLPVATEVVADHHPATSLAVFSAAATDREAQLRGIARQIKQLLTDHPSLRPSDCVITFRQVTPYLSLARQVFSEYDLPLDPAAAVKLRSRPLGVWFGRLMELQRNGWRVRDLAAVLSSGLINLDRWGIGRPEVATFVRHARRMRLWSGMESLQTAVEGLRDEAEATSTPTLLSKSMRDAADGVEQALADLQALLGASDDSPSGHAATVDHALFGPQALIDARARSTVGASTEMDALREYIREIAKTDDALGGTVVSRETFLATLGAKLDAPVVVLREAGGVLLAPMHTLHGLRFKHVVIGGLVEGEFPALRTATSLLGRSARELLAASGLPLPPEPRSSEDQLWASVRSRADESLTLWRSRLNERGRPAAPSYYFTAIECETLDIEPTIPATAASRRELAIASTQQWANGSKIRPLEDPSWATVRIAASVEQLRRSFGHAGQFEGSIEANLVPHLTSASASWSASRLESYLTCGFQFFGSYGLKLNDVDEEMAEADAATRGIVVHDILEDALKPFIAAKTPLTPDTVDKAIERLRANGPEIWTKAPQDRGFGHAGLWNLDQKPTFDQMEALLHREAEAGAALGIQKVFGVETNLAGSLPLDPPMHVSARVDRLDQGDNLAVIVDYKSGRPIQRRDLENGRLVQLQLYSYLASKQQGAQRLVARYGWLTPPKKEWDLDSSNPDDAQLIEDVLDTADKVRRQVDSGNFQVAPQVSSCPPYCAMIHVCRVNEFTRWKQWT